MLCESGDCPHISIEHDGYDILEPGAILRVAGPMLSLTCCILSAALSGALPGIGGALSGVFSKVTNISAGINSRFESLEFRQRSI